MAHPEDQPVISDEVLRALGDIYVRHGAHKAFGVHLLHSHFHAPDDTVLMGRKVSLGPESDACWTQVMPIHDLKNVPMHAHVLRLTEQGLFVPYEYHRGTLSAAALTVPAAFFEDLAKFLRDKDLADLIALEVIHESEKMRCVEFVAGESTVVLAEKDTVDLEFPSITTGWSFHVSGDGIISYSGGTVYAAKKKGHAVFVDSKSLPTVDALIETLKRNGILA